VDSGAAVLGGETGERCFCCDRFGKKGDYIRLSSLAFIGFQSTTYRPAKLTADLIRQTERIRAYLKEKQVPEDAITTNAIEDDGDSRSNS
jgi:hypothetical protein